jgi:hypothetical protein
MRAAVSIACVFNDEKVRKACLDRSIQDLADQALDVDYIPIDNVGHDFTSAGAALNHAAARARNEVVVFVHQDVYLHSLVALERAAARMTADAGIGLLGAAGVAADGRAVGRIRDRVVLLGDRAPAPEPVDSLDEVLFMIRRDRVLAEPLTEDPDLAWHAYAVEYGLRCRDQGLRVVATDLPLTHNSLTINLARLLEAHQLVASRYPGQVPVRTTCGTVGQERPVRDLVPEQLRWRYRWLRESSAVRELQRALPGRPFVLADIRRDVDDVLARSPGSMLVANHCADGDFEPAGSWEHPLTLPRRDRTVGLTSVAAGPMTDLVTGRPADHSLLLTNLGPEQLRGLAGPLAAEEAVVLGYHGGIDCWALVGPAAKAAPPAWFGTRSTPAWSRPRLRDTGIGRTGAGRGVPARSGHADS